MTTRPIFLTTKEINTQAMKWAIESRWPQYVLHTAAQSSHLPQVLDLLAPDEYPSLIVLDARTATLERLK